MNAVEIEEAVSALAERPFDAEEFPFAFLQAFGNKEPRRLSHAQPDDGRTPVWRIESLARVARGACSPSAVPANKPARRTRIELTHLSDLSGKIW